MHPGFFAWWKHAQRAAACGERAHCGPVDVDPVAARLRRGLGAWAHGPGDDVRHASGGFENDCGGAFGVRRPLRFLAHKLELEEAQVAELAVILDELKTERAQAAVDYRRTTSMIADGIAAGTFDGAKVAEANALRVKSAERVGAAVNRALERLHALLDEEQRKRLAYLLRTGVLSI